MYVGWPDLPTSRHFATISRFDARQPEVQVFAWKLDGRPVPSFCACVNNGHAEHITDNVAYSNSSCIGAWSEKVPETMTLLRFLEHFAVQYSELSSLYEHMDLICHTTGTC
jgi:hypothetical protein